MQIHSNLQVYLLFDFQLLLDVNAVYDEPFFWGLVIHVLLSKHLVSNFFDLLDGVGSLNCSFKAIIFEKSTGPSITFDLGFDYEASGSIVDSEGPSHIESLLFVEGYLPFWDWHHILVHELGSLVLVEQHHSLGKLSTDVAQRYTLSLREGASSKELRKCFHYCWFKL